MEPFLNYFHCPETVLFVFIPPNSGKYWHLLVSQDFVFFRISFSSWNHIVCSLSRFILSLINMHLSFLHILYASLVAQTVKRLPAMWETWFNPWVGKIPWRRKWQPTPVLLPGKSHGQRTYLIMSWIFIYFNIEKYSIVWMYPPFIYPFTY